MLAEPEPTAGSRLAELYRTIAVQTAVRLAGSNIVGAAVTFSYVSYVVPIGGRQKVPSIDYLYVLVAYAACVTPIVIASGLRAAHRVEKWIEADRDPTPEEKVAVLDQPYVQTRFSFRAWVGAAIVFTAFGITQGVTAFDCARIALGALLGGLTTSAFCFLLVERMHRPAFAAALSDGVLPERHGIQIRQRLLLMWILGSGVPFVGIILAPFGRDDATRGEIVTPIVVLAVIGLVVGLLVTAISARSLTDPLDEVRDGLERVLLGDLHATIPIDDGGELGALEAGYNRMLAGLRERDRLADLFGRHVGVDVAKKAHRGRRATRRRVARRERVVRRLDRVDRAVAKPTRDRGRRVAQRVLRRDRDRGRGEPRDDQSLRRRRRLVRLRRARRLTRCIPPTC